MAAEMASWGWIHVSIARLTCSRTSAHHSETRPPFRTTSISNPLLTVPRSVTPSSAWSRSKSGTPSFRYRAGRRNVIGASMMRPARHSDTRSSAAAPLTLTATPPSAGSHAPRNRTATTSTLSEVNPSRRDASSTSTARDGSGSCRPAGPTESMRNPPNSRFRIWRIDESRACARASDASAAPPVVKPNTSATSTATGARRHQHTRAYAHARDSEQRETHEARSTFSPTTAPARRLRAGRSATAATPRLMQVAASSGSLLPSATYRRLVDFLADPGDQERGSFLILRGSWRCGRPA